MKVKSLKTVLYVLVLITMMLSVVQCTPAPVAAPEPAKPAEKPAEPAKPAEKPAEPAKPAVVEPTKAPVVEPTKAPEKPAKPYEGVKLNLASMTDQYVQAFRVLVPKFKEQTGIEITLDELGYVDLRQKLTADFVGKTAQYDLMTMDIVWSGEFGKNGYTIPLNDLMERDKDAIKKDDILPVMWTQGEYEGKYWAFPLGGYANVLNYRKDLFEAKGIKPPTTLEEMVAAAKALNDPAKEIYGMALLGAGSAGAQDFMVWVQQSGGTLMKDGKPLVNSPENAKTLEMIGELFKYAPPGSTEYWWGERETAFRDGRVAMMEGWSISRNDYEDATMSKVVGKVDITYAPVAAGKKPTYGFGGWGIGINASSDKKKQEAAWEFIKWLSSPEIQTEWVLNRGVPIRRSTMTDPKIVEKLPWMPLLLESFDKGDGNYRPRIPEYSIVEDALGTFVNKYLIGEIKSAQDTLDQAQKQIETNLQ